MDVNVTAGTDDEDTNSDFGVELDQVQSPDQYLDVSASILDD